MPKKKMLLTWPNLSSFRRFTSGSTSGGDLDLYLSRSPGETEFWNKLGQISHRHLRRHSPVFLRRSRIRVLWCRPTPWSGALQIWVGDGRLRPRKRADLRGLRALRSSGRLRNLADRRPDPSLADPDADLWAVPDREHRGEAAGRGSVANKTIT